MLWGSEQYNNEDARDCLNLTAENIRLFGINTFDSNAIDIENQFWVLPKVWLENHENHWQMNVVVDIRHQSLDDCWAKLTNIFKAMQTKKNIDFDQTFYQVTHYPDKQSWIKNVKYVQKAIANEAVQKVVLADKVRLGLLLVLGHLNCCMIFKVLIVGSIIFVLN